ncbi:stem 28 kDa glycoprotein-like [Vigna umbellata]|uniref:stem 28 kDa glycoprotein-like n=1 Tax=Vigna umbellata TaxID=87088 RepID=UPI001F5E5A6E|nr:stem 28 kDa glycoprotein-like [Vigna umbellata]
MKVLVLFVATVLVACHASDYQMYPLRLKTGHVGQYSTEVLCGSWRLGVEANNLIKWKTVPEACQEFVADYVLGNQYRSDSKTVCREAYFYAKTLNITDKDVFVFDVDETLLCNLQYYSKHGFGVERFNATAFANWVAEGEAYALPETLVLYDKLMSLGIKVVFLTERLVSQRAITVANLKDVGFDKWEKLILKDPAAYTGKSTLTYKATERRKLEESGYRIIGNVGDQWTDLMGSYRGLRTFKLPNPMYYIG